MGLYLIPLGAITGADSGTVTVAGITDASTPAKNFLTAPTVADMLLAIGAASVAALNLKADDSSVVKLSGAQTVAGVKTFGSIPVLPAGDPVASNEATRKAYVDAGLAGKVGLSGAETVSGVKTFGSIPVLPASDPTAANEAARKAYVDAGLAGKVGLTGSETVAGVKTFSAVPVLPGTDPVGANDAARKGYVDAGLALKADDTSVVKVTGAQTVAGVKTFSAVPVLPGTDPAAANEATRKAYVDAQVATRADDTLVVKLSGAQTVAGVKTFSSIPILPAVDPTAANEATRKAYVDAGFAVKADDSAVVKLAGAQTVAGVKTFSSTPLLPSDPTAANEAARKAYVDAVAALKADDTAVVKVAGAQTVAGVKTFSSIPVLPGTDPTASNEATRKGYVDSVVAFKADDSAVVKLTGAQTVAGVKTFSSTPLLPSDPTAANEATRKAYVDARTPIEYVFWDGAAWPAKQGTGDLAWYISAFDPAAPSPADMVVGDIWLREAGA